MKTNIHKKIENLIKPLQITATEQVDGLNARDLHEMLEIKKDFSSWIKLQIQRGDFELNDDYIISHFRGEDGTFGGKDGFSGKSGATKKEYFINIDMAKNISMMANVKKGKEVRRAFIQVEKQYKQLISKQNQKSEAIDYDKLGAYLQKIINTNDEDIGLLVENIKDMKLITKQDIQEAVKQAKLDKARDNYINLYNHTLKLIDEKHEAKKAIEQKHQTELKNIINRYLILPLEKFAFNLTSEKRNYILENFRKRPKNAQKVLDAFNESYEISINDISKTNIQKLKSYEIDDIFIQNTILFFETHLKAGLVGSSIKEDIKPKIQEYIINHKNQKLLNN